MEKYVDSMLERQQDNVIITIEKEQLFSIESYVPNYLMSRCVEIETNFSLPMPNLKSLGTNINFFKISRKNYSFNLMILIFKIINSIQD